MDMVIDFTVVEAERRAGDPACVIAANDRITKILGWQPRFNDLDPIVRTALDWEKKLYTTARSMPELVT
jgi:UDP-glucose 4-epimerase